MAQDDQKKLDNDAERRRGVPYIPRHAVDPASVPAYGRAGETKAFDQKLHFRKCSDVNVPFNSLEVSKGADGRPFMIITVTLEYKLCFQIWSEEKIIELSIDDIMNIYARASKFLPEAILLSDSVLDAEDELRASGFEPQTD